jgi:hypothetical protein
VIGGSGTHDRVVECSDEFRAGRRVVTRHGVLRGSWPGRIHAGHACSRCDPSCDPGRFSEDS